MSGTPKSRQRSLGEIEANLTIARDALNKAEMELRRVGHHDSADEVDALASQIRRLRTTTQTRLAE